MASLTCTVTEITNVTAYKAKKTWRRSCPKRMRFDQCASFRKYLPRFGGIAFLLLITAWLVHDNTCCPMSTATSHTPVTSVQIPVHIDCNGRPVTAPRKEDLLHARHLPSSRLLDLKCSGGGTSPLATCLPSRKRRNGNNCNRLLANALDSII